MNSYLSTPHDSKAEVRAALSSDEEWGRKESSNAQAGKMQLLTGGLEESTAAPEVRGETCQQGAKVMQIKEVGVSQIT